jgi:hypothetical protein
MEEVRCFQSNPLRGGRVRPSGKMAISAKKGQAETCPYPQKEGK